MQTQEQVVEELYRDFRKRVEKKLKTEVEAVHIRDHEGEVVVEIVPKRVVSRFGSGTGTPEPVETSEASTDEGQPEEGVE